MMNKKEALEKYERAKSKGEVDKDIISLLEKINSLPYFYTTSSCSGRIVLLNIPEIGDKKDAKFVCKWHREVDKKELVNCLKDYKEHYLFFIMQSPIIHIAASDIEWANKLIKISLECGFKYTSIKKIESKKILVEVLSTENLHIPIGREGKIIVKEEQLTFFLEMANKLLVRAKGKLKCLEEKINSLLLSSS